MYALFNLMRFFKGSKGIADSEEAVRYARIQRGGGGNRGSGPPPPQKNHKYIGFLSNTGPEILKILKATKPAFNVGPLSAHQQNAISLAFRWHVDDGSLLVVFGFSPTKTKNTSELQS